MQSKATTVDAYLSSLPEDRRRAISAARAVILKNLDSSYEEGMQYGMIGRRRRAFGLSSGFCPAKARDDAENHLPFLARNLSMNPVSKFPALKSGSAKIFRCSGIVV